MSEFKLLCVGDMHLGRRPSRLPADLEACGVGAHELTPAAAWRASVEWALANRIDAVVLAGDVVESLEDRFEAYGHLEQGVSKLARAGIAVVGVAGNHDVQALPRLAKRIDGFRLLGRGGRWESVCLESRSGVKLQLLGWSFPQQYVRANPLDTLEPADISDDLATLGLLHCDVDKSGSSYAPVPRLALVEQRGVDAWLLGHIHKPDDLSSERRPLGYLGSIVGLDPGEPGRHGPWLARVSSSREITLEQLALAPLRWQRCELDLDSFVNEQPQEVDDDLATALRSLMDDLHGSIKDELGATRMVGCRVRLSGRSPSHGLIRACIERGEILEQRCSNDGVVYFVEKIIDDARPALDLARIAQGDDPPALLARRLLALHEGGEAAVGLIEDASVAIDKAETKVRGAAGRTSGDGGPDSVRELLLRSGTEALEELLADRDGSVEARR